MSQIPACSQVSWPPTPSLGTPTPGQRFSYTPGGSVEDEGQRAESGYKKAVWQAAYVAVLRVAPPGATVQLQQCKTKHNNLKSEWAVWSALMAQSGFSVEDGVVTGQLEALEQYFEAHKEAAKYRDKVTAFEDLQRRLFDGVLATGRAAVTIDNIIAQSVEQGEESVGGRKRHAEETAEAATRAHKNLSLAERLSKNVGKLAYSLDSLVEAISGNPRRDALRDFMDTYEALNSRIKYPIVHMFKDEFLATMYLEIKSKERRS
ncbi:hypothetical protein BU23DRAFT_653091 [Bimuria novae-zelandiae CBS 107.79]|uniref:Myb/SANT-like domain-containing protein n=1 Tax=Bimuria novae-zelandiae CBS 107.79 TaxID=1447943 RepID=A0A6A5UZI9_9PLEO|nr:hypothetical protein BU23DRAFT_653091 [Bimuria novae-zelandiae CBS 107.79]